MYCRCGRKLDLLYGYRTAINYETGEISIHYTGVMKASCSHCRISTKWVYTESALIYEVMGKGDFNCDFLE